MGWVRILHLLFVHLDTRVDSKKKEREGGTLVVLKMGILEGPHLPPGHMG